MQLLSKFELKIPHNLNPHITQPSNSLPFLHYELVTEPFFFRNGGKFPISCCYASTLTLNSEKAFCDQFVMEEWQTIRRLFEAKMAEF